jgi:hypothetical protein
MDQIEDVAIYYNKRQFFPAGLRLSRWAFSCGPVVLPFDAVGHSSPDSDTI